MKPYLGCLICSLVFLTTGSAIAAEHDHQHNQPGQTAEAKIQDGSQAHQQMRSLGSRTAGDLRAELEAMSYDVKARATLKKFGIIASHHIMLSLTNAQSGKVITNARIEAWTEAGTTDKKSPKIKLISMKMARVVGYGGDINIPTEGDPEIVIQAVLPDGQKHQFRF